MNQHLTRWITGLITAPLLFAFILFSTAIQFSLLVILVIELAVREYTVMVYGKQGYVSDKMQIYFCAFLLSTGAVFGGDGALAPLVVFCLLSCYLFFLYQIRDGEIELGRLGKVIIGFLYMPLLLSYFILLRYQPQGVLWVCFILVVAFSGDLCAFYLGRTIGKRKLSPRISPGKTVAGAAGMILGSVAGSLVFRHFFLPEILPHQAFIVGFFSGILGQLGDIFESSLKRYAGIKDAGFLIPGHGGIMDRLDSISFIVPFVFYYRLFVTA